MEVWKMNVKFHENFDYIGEIQKISCAIRNFSSSKHSEQVKYFFNMKRETSYLQVAI